MADRSAPPRAPFRSTRAPFSGSPPDHALVTHCLFVVQEKILHYKSDTKFATGGGGSRARRELFLEHQGRRSLPQAPGWAGALERLSLNDIELPVAPECLRELDRLRDLAWAATACLRTVLLHPTTVSQHPRAVRRQPPTTC